VRLLSATVRNYRLHRETTVNFDPARSLIGGPNESGKSTFIEAVHRGLFLKSKGSTALHRAMASSTHDGHPEVEIVLDAGGKEFTIRKRFSGQSGTTQLIQTGGAALRGDEAEEEIAKLLGQDDGGRTSAGKINEQWAHLWVWQGKSGEDPAAAAASEQTRLLQRLQDNGGAITMQSDRDARVAGLFGAWCDRVFTLAGKPKSGSDLDKAEGELNCAAAAQQIAEARYNRLVQAATDYEVANATIIHCDVDLVTLGEQRASVDDKLSTAKKLKSAEERQGEDAERSVGAYNDLKIAHDAIETLRGVIGDLEKAMTPKSEQANTLQQRCQSTRDESQAFVKSYDEALDASRGLRQRRELARAWVEAFDSRARHQALSSDAEQAGRLRVEIMGLREQLAGLPELDSDGLKALQKVKGRLDQADAALEAMAAGIEVVSADVTVRIGEHELEPGGSHIVTEPTDLHVGEGVHLRVQPGGGVRLSEAREEARDLREALTRDLESGGLKSLEYAVEVLAKRQATQALLDKVESRLEDIDDGELEEDLAVAQDALRAAEAEVSRRLDPCPGIESPADRDAAIAFRTQEEHALGTAETTEQEQKAAAAEARNALEDAEASLQSFKSELEEQQGLLNDKQVELRVMLENHGSDDARSAALRDAEKAKKSAETLLKETRRQLAELEPDQLERDRERLERAIKNKNDERSTSVETRIASRALLRLDGSEDPQSELVRANATELAARERCDSVSRKAEAMQLLNGLFQEQQKNLADRFTRPLADKISEYLRGFFGAGAQALVTFDDGAFKKIELVRPQHAGAMAFDSLSGGTREQVAAAVRLAMAEVLAADHGGCLPVVFDDAFAYSDPDRVKILQRMLDLGATRGLQIIVLTCNPSDYAGLGAKQEILAAPAPNGPGSTPPAAQDAGVSPAEQNPPDTSLANEDPDRFIEALTALNGKAGNTRLREQLGWDEATYATVKDQLISEERIVPGKGRGGSVAIVVD
jgi:hypothetical protein